MASSTAPLPNAAPSTRGVRRPRLPARLAVLWPWLRRWAVPALGVLVLGLLLSHARQVDWAGAWQAVKRYPPGLLAAVFALATLSHALYGCFDLIGKRHTGHGLPWWRSWAIAVTSYAFNLNLGSLVGGVALRARLYARAGLDEAAVAQVVGISLATNWLGYGLLAGGLFAAGAIDPPHDVALGSELLRGLGGGMLLLVAGYVVACARLQGREWRVFGRQVHLPSGRLALLQLGLAAANWALMGTVMYLLLRGQVPYGMVLATLLAASIVGVVMPIPAGLGVLEGVYLALLSGSVRQGALMGAVLAYRAFYYLVPLGGAVLMYLFLERYATAHPAAAEPGG